MIVPHAAHVGVSPQWEDLPNDGHPAQRAVNELHDIGIAHFLKMERTDTQSLVKSGLLSSVFSSYFKGNVWKGPCACCLSNRFCLQISPVSESSACVQ